MKKYIITAVILSLTSIGMYMLKDNLTAMVIISSFGFTIAGNYYGEESASEYYETPQYVIITKEALQAAAKKIQEENDDDEN